VDRQWLFLMSFMGFAASETGLIFLKIIKIGGLFFQLLGDICTIIVIISNFLSNEGFFLYNQFFPGIY
jgi:hypothetical protein